MTPAPLDPEDRETIRAGLWTIYATAALLHGSVPAVAVDAADRVLAAQSERWPDLAEPKLVPVPDDVAATAQTPRRYHEDGCALRDDHNPPCRDESGSDLTIPF